MKDTSYQAAGQVATAGAQAVTQTAGLPAAPSWAGYWTWVAAIVMLMFILYTAKKGTLATWFGFFTWQTPATPTVTNSQGATSLLSGATSIANGLNSALTAAQNLGTSLGKAVGVQ